MPIFDIKNDLVIEYQTSPTAWTAIQADTIQVEIDRGINVEQGVFARPDVGIAVITLQKSNLSDLLTTPAYKSNMNIQVTAKGIALFYGFIMNVSIQYMVETKQIEIQITANDYTKVFLNTTIDTCTIPSGAHSTRGFRTCMGILNGYVAGIDGRMSLTQYGTAGDGTTQRAYTWYDTQAGEIVQQFLDAELGWMFPLANAANMYYMTRLDINALQATTWSTARRTISNVHSTSSQHVCMNGIDFGYDSEGLVNVATVTDTYTGTSVTRTNSTSITNYGRQEGTFEVTFDNSSGSASTLGDWASHVANAANPKSFRSVSCPAVRRDGELSSIVQAEIADVQQIEFAATGFTTLQEIYLVTRVKHSITAEHWEVTLDLWRGI